MFFKVFPFIFFASLAMAQVKGAGEDTYAVVQARVQGLEAKVRSTEAEIQKLIQDKHSSKNAEHTNDVIRNMMSLHKQLDGQIKEYEQQRNLLRYRYPEKNKADVRQYERIELRSLEEMESRMTLGSAVDKTLKTVRKQYPAADKDSKESLIEKKVPAKESQKGQELMEPVILKK
ncbi:hypothetical protein BDW_00960 [Bdellovibrio bacteriovorus W]|nr:hypothetical protein BDW_00960 [Bdellovibrio bacteriovorus W]